MAFAPVFGRVFPATFDRRAAAAAAAAGWWEVAGKTCVAAYQPKGAASLAASYSNLANPGTNDAAPGTAPTWDSATGWTFTRTSSQYLMTTIVATNDQSWSMLARYSNASSYNQALGQVSDGSNREFGMFLSGQTTTYFTSGGYLQKNYSAVTAGVWGLAGNVAYINGVAQSGTISAPSGSIISAMPIAAKWNGSTASDFFGGNIQAWVIYSDTLTAGEVATVSAAMAAL